MFMFSFFKYDLVFFFYYETDKKQETTDLWNTFFHSNLIL